MQGLKSIETIETAKKPKLTFFHFGSRPRGRGAGGREVRLVQRAAGLLLAEPLNSTSSKEMPIKFANHSLCLHPLFLTSNKTQIAVINILNLRILITCVKLLKCVSLICLSPIFVFYSSLNYDDPRTKVPMFGLS